MLGKTEPVWLAEMPADEWVAVDIGGGTQDILLYRPGQPMENCVQLVLPSQTRVVAGQIRAVTAARRPLFLTGRLMGGGASVEAVQEHLQAGLPVYATPEAAQTIFDDLARVRALGVRVVEEAPPEAVTVETTDLQPQALAEALRPFGVELPRRWAVAAQDHGESIGLSNRLFRFQHWRRWLEEEGGDIRRLVYREPPAYMTRLQAIRRTVPGALVADTGAAAIWGALCDPRVEEQRAAGLVVVNCGNQHTVGWLLRGYHVQGLFEHHTSRMTPEKLADYVRRLREGRLTQEEVFDDGGHGCHVRPGFCAGEGYQFVVVTGPRRALASPDWYLAAPYGNMMLAGCYGLLRAVVEQARVGGQA